MRRRIPVYAVVAPPELAGELSDRHHLEYGDSRASQRRKLADRRRPRPLTSKRADVDLRQDLARQLPALPLPVRPRKRPRIHNFRRTMRTFGLIPRCRIRERVFAIEKIAITGSRAGLRYKAREVASILTHEWERSCIRNDIHRLP